eukprot:25774-Prymnesium_polylepis.1
MAGPEYADLSFRCRPPLPRLEHTAGPVCGRLDRCGSNTLRLPAPDWTAAAPQARGPFVTDRTRVRVHPTARPQTPSSRARRA